LLHFWTRFNPANCHAECPTPASLINLSQFGLVLAIPRAPEAAIPATGPAIPSLPSHFALGHLQSQKAERSFVKKGCLLFSAFCTIQWPYLSPAPLCLFNTMIGHW
jgi:hypothetical protein